MQMIYEQNKYINRLSSLQDTLQDVLRIPICYITIGATYEPPI